MNSIITEEDLEKIVSSGKSRPRKSVFLRSVLIVFAFLLSGVLIYVIINFKSIQSNFQFWYKTEYASESNNQQTQDNIVIPKQVTEETTVNLPVIDNNSISIPVLSLKAPITWDVANTPESVKVNLEKGVIHLANTALPGQIGNVFITGHSSNYPWAKGDYNNIFALINKLVIGDLIQIKYQNIDYVYKVSAVKVVKPTNTSVLNSTDRSILTLMTCTPVGTSINRLILIADQVYPDPKSNVAGTATGSNTLPYAR